MPEFKWVIHPIDIIYRFWELFDMDNISNSNYFLDVKIDQN